LEASSVMTVNTTPIRDRTTPMIDIISRASSSTGGVTQPSVLVHMSYSSKITSDSIQVTLMLVQAHPLLTLSSSHTLTFCMHILNSHLLLLRFTYHKGCKVGEVVTITHDNIIIISFICLASLSCPVATATCKKSNKMYIVVLKVRNHCTSCATVPIEM